ncbi:MAG: response regulator [Burkholderiales bacterium]
MVQSDLEVAREPRLRKSRRVLVVEDNLDTLHSLTYILRKEGHQVEFAINGYAALEIARRFRPEFVFLDLGLPGIDGFDVCSQLKSEPGFRATRFIAVTGYAQEDYRTRARAAGCELHIVKPADPLLLLALLET